MAGMHDDYMEGKLDAARYAEVLKKVYDALAECDYKHTMSSPVATKISRKKVLDALAKLDETLNEGSEKYYAAKYTAVDNSGNKTVKKICFRCDGTIEDAEKEVDALIKEPYTELKVIGSCLKGVAEKDGYKLIESVENDVEGDEVVAVESVASNDYGTPEDWEELESAETMDDAREWCNLTLWKNISTGKYVIIIGDNNPWEGYSNMETFSEDEARYEFSAYLNEPMYNSDDYDDDYSDDYDESLEKCSGIKAHKVIMVRVSMTLV
jgi:hypothetical protein